MTITLSGITLPDHLHITPEEFSDSGVYSETERADDGTLHIWEQAEPGREFDLAGGAGYGWIDRQTLSDLHGLAMQPNAEYELNYHGSVRAVRFRNYDPPVIEPPDMVFDYAPPADTDMYDNFRLKLLEI